MTPSADHFKSKAGIKRIFNAARYSLQGLRAAFVSEAAFRQELFLCLFFVPFAFILGETSIEKLFLLFTLFIVLVVELLNSALEVLADRITKDYDEQIGKAKDIASAAIFLCLIFVGTSWIYFILKRFFF